MKEKLLEKLISLLSRKWLVVLLTLALAFIALMLGKLDQGGFVTIALAVPGAYITGNVYEKIAGK